MKEPKSGSHIETSQEETRTESSIMWAGIGLDSRLELSTRQFSRGVQLSGNQAAVGLKTI